MTLSELKDQELVERVREFAREERRITESLLACLEEVERRELHLRLGYGSLFAWLCEGLGYSEDQAQYRIDAMRVLRDVPEAREALEQGCLKLTHLARTHRFFRGEERRGVSYSVEEKRDFLLGMKGTSLRECYRKMVEKSPESVFTESVRVVAGRKTQITFVVSAELAAEMEEMRLIWGLETYGELFERMTRMLSKKVLKPVPAQLSNRVEILEDEPPASRYIPMDTRRQVWIRDDGRCSFVSSETGKRCDSTFALQIDHLHPYAKGGGHSADNLRLLCRAHNAWRARQEFGPLRVMEAV